MGLFLACVFLGLVAHALPASVRDPVAAVLRRTLVAPLITLQRNAELSRSAWLSHETNIRARDSVALRAMLVPALERENDRLRKLLGLGQQLQWGFVPTEAVHERGMGEEFTLTLTAGANAGVRPFSPVIAPEGLVGMVETVDPSMSLVIVWSHPDFRVSAMSADGNAFGIVAAHLGGSGPERYLLELRGVPLRSTLKPGTLIISSGLGGVYPRGIPIGTVLRQIETTEKWAGTYLIRPAVLPPDVQSVMVLQPQRAAAGVEGVWASSIATADSLAAADSAGADTTAAGAPRPGTPPIPAVGVPTARPDTARPPRPRPVRRDTTRRDTTPVDTARRGTIRGDTVRRDTGVTGGRRDTIRRDTTRRDTTAPRTGRRDTTPSRPDTTRTPPAPAIDPIPITPLTPDRP